MEITEYFQKKFNRKKFFGTIGAGFLSYVVFKSFPFNLFAKKEKIKSPKIKVRINPLAVERKNTGKNNV
jgi:hypothetical protein